MCSDYFARSVIQSLIRVGVFVTPWTAAHQVSLSITNSPSLLKLMFVESVMPSNHLSLFCPLLLPLSIFPSIRVFSNESILCTVPETIYSAMEFKKTFFRSVELKNSSDFFSPLPFNCGSFLRCFIIIVHSLCCLIDYTAGKLLVKAQHKPCDMSLLRLLLCL